MRRGGRAAKGKGERKEKGEERRKVENEEGERGRGGTSYQFCSISGYLS